MLNGFLRYDERQLKVYFLEEIIDIFQQAIRNACNAHNVSIEGVKDFLDNWVKFRVDGADPTDNYLCLYSFSFSRRNKDSRYKTK